MKIHGADGLSAEDIRDEVNRGGRLVIYQYCISVFVLTLKRPTGIYLIKAGRSPAMGGLLFTLVSLLFGWWGIPWGPIYTIGSIHRNLCGGFDVTAAVLRELLPSAPPTAMAPAPRLHETPATSPRKNNIKVAAYMVAGAAALIAGGISIYCYVQSRDLTVVLVSGLDRPYAVTLNGVPYQLAARSTKILTLREGVFTLEDAKGSAVVGAVKTFDCTLPFFSHLSESRLTIVNPDRAAVLFKEDVRYHNSASSASPDDGEPAFVVLANQSSYFIEKPDFVLEPATKSISMPSGTTSLTKTRLEYVPQAGLAQILDVLQRKLNYPAARDHLMIQARDHTDEAFITTAMRVLKPGDFRGFFLPHLADRPVLVEWHRYYQNAIEHVEPDADLPKEYQGYLQAEPDNGALQYLLGRVTLDRPAARQLFTRALTARPPCAYAQSAIGFDAMINGTFAEALEHYQAAERAGVSSQAIAHYRRQVYYGLHQFDALLGEVRHDRAADPLDVQLAADEISAMLAAGQGIEAARKICTAQLAALKAAKVDGKSLAYSSDFLQAGIAYQTGRLTDYADLTSHLDHPVYKFRAAVTRGELEPAAKAALALPYPRPTDRLLLYLLAKHQGNEAGAEKYFTQAVELMRKDFDYRPVAALLTAPQCPAPEALADLAVDLQEKCVLFAALGLWDHDHQKAYVALATKLDVLPDFPHQFLSPFLKPADSSTM